jgi:hypothetical protein
LFDQRRRGVARLADAQADRPVLRRRHDARAQLPQSFEGIRMQAREQRVHRAIIPVGPG